MTENDRDQKPDEQVYQGSKNRSDELPSDPTPDYDEAVEESFPASDPPSTTPGAIEGPDGADR